MLPLSGRKLRIFSWGKTMVFKYKLSSRLQHGDAVELRGKAGENRMIVDFLSDYMACDPGKRSALAVPEDNETEVLPVVTTQPLQIVLETSGTWDVNAASPVSSTSSHGTTAKRFGYRPGDEFFCTILVRPEHFEIRLNDMPFASSEHLVPVSSIHGIQIDGDAMISTICFGHPMAIEKHNRLSDESKVPQATLDQAKGVPSIVECRMAMDEELQAAYMRDSAMDLRKMGNEFSRSAFELFTPNEEKPKEEDYVAELPGLKRATSYQLVFDVEDIDLDDSDRPAMVKNDRLTKSQFNLDRLKQSNRLVNKSAAEREDINAKAKEKLLIKTAPSGVVKKLNSRLDEIHRPGINGIVKESASPNVIRRPSFNSPLSSKLKQRARVPGSHLPPSDGLKLKSRSQQNVSYITDGTQVGTEVRVRPFYKPVLPYEVEQLEQITDEDSQISAPSYRVLFRGDQDNLHPSHLTARDRLRSKTAEFRTEHPMNLTNGFHPRCATYSGSQNVINPVTVRSPLTLLDQQWDRVLPVITNPPDPLPRVGEHSELSAVNTLSSNSEENCPPYVHWYDQMRYTSKPISMVICGDPGSLSSDHEHDEPLPLNCAKMPLQKSNPNKPTKPSSPLSPVNDNNFTHSARMNVSLTKTKELNCADALKSSDKVKSSAVGINNGHFVSRTTTVISNGHAKQKNPETSGEPVLLIDCIPMDPGVCVVQQPMEDWPANNASPENAQVVQPWANRISLQLESRTFCHPVEASRPDGPGEDTESLMSGMTMRSDYGITSSAFDESVDEPAYSIHDPRPPDSRLAVERSVSESSQKPVETHPVCTLRNPENGLDRREVPNQPPDGSHDYSMTHRPDPTPIIHKRSTTAAPKPPLRSASDLRRVVIEKQFPPEIHEVADNNDKGSNMNNTENVENEPEKGSVSTPTEQVAKSTDKLSHVPKLFRGLQTRRSFLSGKWTPKSNRKTDNNAKRNMTVEVKSPTTNGQPTNSSAKVVNGNGQLNVSDNKKQPVQTSKKWFTRKTTGLKL